MIRTTRTRIGGEGQGRKDGGRKDGGRKGRGKSLF
jgi:hypothetical protein